MGGDLQTLRDTLHPPALPEEQGVPYRIPVPALASGAAGPGHLFTLLDRPFRDEPPAGLVVLLHGLGGSSSRQGLRRLGLTLQHHGFAVLRVNLRGADPGRHLAAGTYAARCNSDLLPVLAQARQLCADLAVERPAIPLYGAGVSLGGTMLLNAAFSSTNERVSAGLSLAFPPLDALFCASSPLDLADCSASIERPRNRIYQRWLLQRLVRQTLADPFGVSEAERQALTQSPPASIRAFDEAITAPRWGFDSVDSYYTGASPLSGLLDDAQSCTLPPTLLVQALDDPWVPARAAQQVEARTGDSRGSLSVLLTSHGGHNGFHAPGDSLATGCWSDRVAAAWFSGLSGSTVT